MKENERRLVTWMGILLVWGFACFLLTEPTGLEHKTLYTIGTLVALAWEGIPVLLRKVKL